MGSGKATFERQICLLRLIKVLYLRGENCLQNAHFYRQKKGPGLKHPFNWTGSVFPFLIVILPMDSLGVLGSVFCLFFTGILRVRIKNAPSTAGNSMTSSERPSPERILEKEASPAVLGGREFWKRSGSLKCLEL